MWGKKQWHNVDEVVPRRCMALGKSRQPQPICEHIWGALRPLPPVVISWHCSATFLWANEKHPAPGLFNGTVPWRKSTIINDQTWDLTNNGNRMGTVYGIPLHSWVFRRQWQGWASKYWWNIEKTPLLWVPKNHGTYPWGSWPSLNLSMSWTIEGTAANHDNQVGSKDWWACSIYIYISLSLSLISAQYGCTAPTKSTDYVKHLSFIDFNREQGFQYLSIPGGRSTSV